MVVVSRERAEAISSGIIQGMSLRQIATRMDLSPEGVRQILDAHPDLAKAAKKAREERRSATKDDREARRLATSDATRSMPRASTNHYSDAQLAAEFMRFAASRGGGPLSSSQFITWTRVHADCPSLSTYLIRFGPTWADVCARYDQTPVSATGRGRTLVGAEECLAAVACVQALLAGRPPTSEQYGSMKEPGDPAPKTVAVRLGGGRWSGVVALLLAER